jgi:hypothetical protein
MAYTLLFREKHLFSLIAAGKSFSLIIAGNLSMRDHACHFLAQVPSVVARLQN